MSLSAGDQYLRNHAAEATIRNQVRTFRWYLPEIPENATVLDWGCNHAPDSCLLRAWFGERLNLHSCDFVDRQAFRVFQDFARSEHVKLVEDVALPYPANHFDVVIGSGVLEHTATDYESLLELRRILKPDGVLVVSYLPNWLSLQEWRLRVIHKKDFHRRLYGMSESKQLLKRGGFYPTASGYHTFFWNRLLSTFGLGHSEILPKILSRLFPIQIASATLYFIARKVNVM